LSLAFFSLSDFSLLAIRYAAGRSDVLLHSMAWNCQGKYRKYMRFELRSRSSLRPDDEPDLDCISRSKDLFEDQGAIDSKVKISMESLPKSSFFGFRVSFVR
jgi:hypothetical protein